MLVKISLVDKNELVLPIAHTTEKAELVLGLPIPLITSDLERQSCCRISLSAHQLKSRIGFK